jgi:hypothetical protein
MNYDDIILRFLIQCKTMDKFGLNCYEYGADKWIIDIRRCSAVKGTAYELRLYFDGKYAADNANTCLTKIQNIIVCNYNKYSLEIISHGVCAYRFKTWII